MKKDFFEVTEEILKTIKERIKKRPENSYTVELFDKGKVEIIKKVGEEAIEVIIAAQSQKKSAQIYEFADLWFHLLVLLEMEKISLDEITKELKKRFK